MKYQNLHNIIFSDELSYRWKRHLLFWLAVFVYHMVRIGIMMPAVNTLHSFLTLFEFSFFRGVIPNVLFTYSLVYYWVPKFFNRKKYIAFIAGTVLSIVLLQLYGIINNFFHSDSQIMAAIHRGKFINWPIERAGVIRLFGNPPLIFGLFLSLKILKNWHLEQLKTETLAKENTNAELQLLKAQVHPHFLFNTLNNIYSFTLTHSPLAGTLVQKLSDLLNYMIHECKEPYVPLEKEIKLIRDYMGLEKVRYGNRLDMQVAINGEYKNKIIAPLLMIPFLENCFKHGASVMRGQQWIRLNIFIKADQLEFDLSNSKPSQTIDTISNKGIGLANVEKRLQLLYPGKYSLKIASTTDTFIVHLMVSLQQLEEQNIETKFNLTPKLQPY